MSKLFLYIDPGSGSFILQFIIGGALAVAFFFKAAWYRIRDFFTKKNVTDKNS